MGLKKLIFPFHVSFPISLVSSSETKNDNSCTRQPCCSLLPCITSASISEKRRGRGKKQNDTLPSHTHPHTHPPPPRSPAPPPQREKQVRLDPGRPGLPTPSRRARRGGEGGGEARSTPRAGPPPGLRLWRATRSTPPVAGKKKKKKKGGGSRTPPSRDEGPPAPAPCPPRAATRLSRGRRRVAGPQPLGRGAPPTGGAPVARREAGGAHARARPRLGPPGPPLSRQGGAAEARKARKEKARARAGAAPLSRRRPGPGGPGA